MQNGDRMAKKETYDMLFSDIAEATKSVISDKRDALAVAKIILRSKLAILREYLSLNVAVRAEYMENGVEKLDRHKCGACFMIAFEMCLLFIDDNKKYETYREKVAIIAALTVVATFAEDEARRQGNYEMLAHLDEHKGLVMLTSTQDKKPYDKIWAMSLRKVRRINTNKQRADAVPIIAKNLFGIEMHNLLLARLGTNKM